MKNSAINDSRSKDVDYDQPAGAVVAKLGGLANVCRMSKDVLPDGKPYTTSRVWGWMRKGVIPILQIPYFIEIGKRMRPKVQLKADEFLPKVEFNGDC